MFGLWRFQTFALGIISSVVTAGGSQICQAETTTKISVAVLPDAICSCGVHSGGFDAIYKNKTISINFSFNPNSANPIDHPVVVTKNNKSVKDGLSYICSFGDERCRIAGSQITVQGKWCNFDVDGFDFDAYRIALPASSNNNPSFDCGKAITPSEIAICNNARLSQMDRELASLYRSNMKEYEENTDILKQLRGTQKSWLTERNQCGSNVSCLQARYQERIGWLNGL